MALRLATRVDVRMAIYYDRARFDDLELDARSQYVGKRESALNYIGK